MAQKRDPQPVEGVPACPNCGRQVFDDDDTDSTDCPRCRVPYPRAHPRGANRG